MTAQPQKPEQEQDTRQIHAQMGSGMSLGITLLANVLVAMAMGYGLDKWLDTNPLFLLLFIFLGFAAGMRSIWKIIQRKK